MKSVFKLNQVILIVIFAQFIFTMAANLNVPLFAIFVVRDVGTVAAVVGFASAIYWMVKSVIQLPVARFIDRNHGEIDDYFSLLLGIAISTAGTFLFYFAHSVWHVFAIQFLIAIGDAFAVPPLYAIFTRHLDKDAEGFEWTLQSSFSLGAGSAIGGALSGILAATIGIRSAYLINGLLMSLGWIILLFLRPYIRPKTGPVERGVYLEQKRV